MIPSQREKGEDAEKRTDRYASLSFLHAELNCRNFIRLKWNKIAVVELIL